MLERNISKLLENSLENLTLKFNEAFADNVNNIMSCFSYIFDQNMVILGAKLSETLENFTQNDSGMIN